MEEVVMVEAGQEFWCPFCATEFVAELNEKTNLLVLVKGDCEHLDKESYENAGPGKWRFYFMEEGAEG